MNDVPDWVYKIIESFITKIDINALNWMVVNNYSLLEFTLHHPGKDSVLFWLKFFSPFIKIENIDENKVLELFKKKRPDIFFVLSKNNGWLHKQFVEISDYLINGRI